MTNEELLTRIIALEKKVAFLENYRKIQLAWNKKANGRMSALEEAKTIGNVTVTPGRIKVEVE